MVIENEKKALAEKEALKLKQIADEVAREEVLSKVEGDDSEPSDSDDSVDFTASGDSETADSVAESDSKKDVSEKSETPTDASDKLESDQKIYTEEERKILLGNDFNNLIDEGALSYQTSYYNLKMKVPFGFWFKNFGPNDQYLFRVGFSTQDMYLESDALFWLYVVSSSNGTKTFEERIEDNNLIIEFPRTNSSFFRFVGPVEYRDAMRSILLTIE